MAHPKDQERHNYFTDDIEVHHAETALHSIQSTIEKLFARTQEIHQWMCNTMMHESKLTVHSYDCNGMPHVVRVNEEGTWLTLEREGPNGCEVLWKRRHMPNCMVTHTPNGNYIILVQRIWNDCTAIDAENGAEYVRFQLDETPQHIRAVDDFFLEVYYKGSQGPMRKTYAIETGRVVEDCLRTSVMQPVR